MKARESRTQRDVDGLRAAYEALDNIPLRVKFVGSLSVANMAMVVPALVAEDFAPKPISHQTVLDLIGGLRVQVTKAVRAEWFSVNDRVDLLTAIQEISLVTRLKRRRAY